MEISICSFSFHRLLASGKQNIFQYIEDCKMLGCTQLDPWHAHLPEMNTARFPLPSDLNRSHHLTEEDLNYLSSVKEAADQAELPFGCIAVDGAHIYEENVEDRMKNRANAYRWISIAQTLGASQIRIDTGGPEDLPESVLEIILEGYLDLLNRTNDAGIQIIMENHWGPTKHPEHVVKIMEALPGLGLLLDSWNWAHGKQAEGWLNCAKYAKLTHIKTFDFTEDGQELTQNIPSFCKHLIDSGYTGCWGIESVPRNGNEIEGARKTIELIQRSLSI